MSLATLLNIPADIHDQEAFDQFSFSNQNSHNKIVAAILAQHDTTLSIYVLDPMPLHDPGVWLQNHQQAHNDFNSITGVPGNDLTSVDWNNEQEKAYWMELHWSEHQQNEQILGITG